MWGIGWVNFKIPNSELSISMIQSGFGDGKYPVYFGQTDKAGIDYFKHPGKLSRVNAVGRSVYSLDT